MNLHYSQTQLYRKNEYEEFKYLTNLHYSQTEHMLAILDIRLNTLRIYTILKLIIVEALYVDGLNTLRIYTILKPVVEAAL